MVTRSKVPVVLACLVLLDVTLAVTGLAFPRLWFRVFHGAEYVDPQGLLPRTAASWTAFAVLQAIAWRRWRRRPEWLAIVAGVRWSDMLTDWTYLYVCQSATWFARASLLVTSPANAVIGWWLLREYRRARALMED